MKHIKSINKLANEGNITWKSINWTWSCIYFKYYKEEYSNKPMTHSDISLVINSIDSKPMAFEEIYIDRIRSH
jgi:hypothetical protein